MSMRSAFALVLVAALAVGARADACSSAGGIALMDPPRDATHVPTDVELWLINTVELTRRPLLTDPDGVAVPYTLRTLEEPSRRGTHLLLRPDAPLRPRTRYTFRDPGASPTEYVHAFETGDGPSLDPPAAIRVEASQVVDNMVRSSCGYSSLACDGLSYRGVVDVTIRGRCDGAVLDRYLTRTDEGGLQVRYDGIAIRVPFCAELRARRADGARGPVATFCTDPAAVSIVASTCELSCRGGVGLVDGMTVGLPPDDRTPDRCLQRGFTQERWTELRAVHDAMRTVVSEGCLLPDGGRAPTDAGVVATDGGGVEAIDAGADAGTPAGTVVSAGCGCRAGGDARAKGWWALALVALWRRRRSR